MELNCVRSDRRLSDQVNLLARGQQHQLLVNRLSAVRCIDVRHLASIAVVLDQVPDLERVHNELFVFRKEFVISCISLQVLRAQTSCSTHAYALAGSIIRWRPLQQVWMTLGSAYARRVKSGLSANASLRSICRSRRRLHSRSLQCRNTTRLGGTVNVASISSASALHVGKPTTIQPLCRQSGFITRLCTRDETMQSEHRTWLPLRAATTSPMARSEWRYFNNRKSTSTRAGQD